jgi:hypothetical protein
MYGVTKMIQIKIKNATDKEEMALINKIVNHLDKETEITSTRANKTHNYTKEDLQQKYKCPNGQAICNIGYACDACIYNTDLHK